MKQTLIFDSQLQTNNSSQHRQRPVQSFKIFWNNEEIPGAIYFGPDGAFIPNFLNSVLHRDPQSDFVELLRNYPWNSRNDEDMKLRGTSLKRTKFLLSENKGTYYQYPGASAKIPSERMKSIAEYPMMTQIVDALNASFSYSYITSSNDGNDCDDICSQSLSSTPAFTNHVIGTAYIDGLDCIGAHSDKIKTIANPSLITSLSYGDPRELWFWKNQTAPSYEAGNEQGFANYPPDMIFVLRPGDLLTFGFGTNASFKHGIAPQKYERVIQRFGVPATIRVSLVLRNICYQNTEKQLQEKSLKIDAERSKRLKKRIIAAKLFVDSIIEKVESEGFVELGCLCSEAPVIETVEKAKQSSCRCAILRLLTQVELDTGVVLPTDKMFIVNLNSQALLQREIAAIKQPHATALKNWAIRKTSVYLYHLNRYGMQRSQLFSLRRYNEIMLCGAPPPTDLHKIVEEVEKQLKKRRLK